MNKFINYLEIDISLEILIFKTEKKELTSKVKINEKETKELKIRKTSILFISFDENEENNSFIIKLYPTNNFLISIEYTLEDKESKEDFEKLKEYLKTLIL